MLDLIAKAIEKNDVNEVKKIIISINLKYKSLPPRVTLNHSEISELKLFYVFLMAYKNNLNNVIEFLIQESFITNRLGINLIIEHYPFFCKKFICEGINFPALKMIFEYNVLPEYFYTFLLDYAPQMSPEVIDLILKDKRTIIETQTIKNLLVTKNYHCLELLLSDKRATDNVLMDPLLEVNKSFNQELMELFFSKIHMTQRIIVTLFAAAISIKNFHTINLIFDTQQHKFESFNDLLDDICFKVITSKPSNDHKLHEFTKYFPGSISRLYAQNKINLRCLQKNFPENKKFLFGAPKVHRRQTFKKNGVFDTLFRMHANKVYDSTYARAKSMLTLNLPVEIIEIILSFDDFDECFDEKLFWNRIEGLNQPKPSM